MRDDKDSVKLFEISDIYDCDDDLKKKIIRNYRKWKSGQKL